VVSPIRGEELISQLESVASSAYTWMMIFNAITPLAIGALFTALTRKYKYFAMYGSR
jgi:hypothetical protein